MHLLEPARSAWFITNPTTTTSNWLNHSCTRTLSHFLGYPRCFNRSKYFNPLQPQRHTLSLNLAKSWDLGVASVTNVCVCVIMFALLLFWWRIETCLYYHLEVLAHQLEKIPWTDDSGDWTPETFRAQLALNLSHRNQSILRAVHTGHVVSQHHTKALIIVYLYSSRNLGVRQDKRREQPFVFYYWKVWGVRPKFAKWGEKTPFKNMRNHGKLGK